MKKFLARFRFFLGKNYNIFHWISFISRKNNVKFTIYHIPSSFFDLCDSLLPVFSILKKRLTVKGTVSFINGKFFKIFVIIPEMCGEFPFPGNSHYHSPFPGMGLTSRGVGIPAFCTSLNHSFFFASSEPHKPDNEMGAKEWYDIIYPFCIDL